MKTIVNLSLKSEFNFKQTFGKVDTLINYTNGHGYLGIADFNNTFSHVYLQKLCDKNKIKPIFGVRLEVLKDPGLRERGKCGPIYTFIAKNESGLQQINALVKKAWENFYYKPMIGWIDVFKLDENVVVIAENMETTERVDYIGLTPRTPFMLMEFDIPKVYLNDNSYPTVDDRKIYQMLAGATKRGDEYYYNFNTRSSPMHILSTEEFHRIWKCEEAIENTHKIAEQCDARLPKAKMVKYKGKGNIDTICKANAKRKGVDLSDPIYSARYEKEMELIKKKDYVDYFMIVAEMIVKAKKKMFVGPARGSAAGSLVCYLMDITEVDPIRFGLIFERFIDINREDLPDIDIDFPDEERPDVIKDLFKTHGSNNVCHIANINEYQAKSAINDVGMSLRIPKFEVDILKDAIVDRSGGDARAAMSIKDTLETTDIGKEFSERFPAIALAEKLQGHATHAGKHAAGVIVCNDDLTKYGGINMREGSIMMDKKGAEYLNLLKIDCLGLRTLTILQECAKLIGMDHKDYYTMPLDNEKAFRMFKEMRLNGIFQFEGQAMRMLCEGMGVEDFNDIVAITALARPGPLHSGAADIYVKRRTGLEDIEYICQHPKYIENTKWTYGVIVYQEQLMNLCRECGNMSWEDVSEIRKAASKTLGKEFFNQYKEKFLKGAKENKIDDEEAEVMWENMMTFGSWGMNLSHSVSYGYISYWCAYMKANHPLEFVVATLRHAKSPESVIKILRDAYENDGIEYVPVDPDHSGIDWTVHDGKLIGGLMNIKGIGDKKAQAIIDCREGRAKWTTSMINILTDPVTPFDSIYPCRDKWGDIYEKPWEFGLSVAPSEINTISAVGTYVFIGKVTRRDLRDLNEYNELMKRGGKVYHTNNKSLKLTIEDDTGSINCSISRMKFDKLNGQKLVDTLVEGESWVIIKGEIREGWRVIHIDNIFDLKDL